MDSLQVILLQYTVYTQKKGYLTWRAVFLRVLEYYAGILFLTTNRIGDFDEAFTSRIHISLYYPPLDKTSTREIFRLNLRIIKKRFEDKGRIININERDILKYATAYWKKHENMRWNGRQIRNACQTALAMAEFDAQTASGGGDAHATQVELTHHHVQIVSDAYLEFMRYLKSIYGFSADEVAKNMRLRAKHPKAAKKDEDDDDDTTDTSDDEAIYGPTKGTQPAIPPSAISGMVPPMTGMPPMMAGAIPNTGHMPVSTGLATPSSTSESAAPQMMPAQGSYVMANGPQGMYWMPQQFAQGQNHPQQPFMMGNQQAMFNPGQQVSGQNWPNGNGNGAWPMMQNMIPSQAVSRGNEGASPVAQS